MDESGDDRKVRRESMHRDVAFANQYRIELLKWHLGITAGLFGFSAVFRPGLQQVVSPLTMWVGWAALAVSMFGAIGQMIGWDQFYISYRDYDYRSEEEEGRKKREVITRRRKSAMLAQYAGFLVGVAAIAIFAGVNIDNAKKTEPTPVPVNVTVTLQPPIIATSKEPSSASSASASESAASMIGAGGSGYPKATHKKGTQ